MDRNPELPSTSGDENCEQEQERESPEHSLPGDVEMASIDDSETSDEDPTPVNSDIEWNLVSDTSNSSIPSVPNPSSGSNSPPQLEDIPNGQHFNEIVINHQPMINGEAPILNGVIIHHLPNGLAINGLPNGIQEDEDVELLLPLEPMLPPIPPIPDSNPPTPPEDINDAEVALLNMEMLSPTLNPFPYDSTPSVDLEVAKINESILLLSMPNYPSSPRAGPSGIGRKPEKKNNGSPDDSLSTDCSTMSSGFTNPECDQSTSDSNGGRKAPIKDILRVAEDPVVVRPIPILPSLGRRTLSEGSGLAEIASGQQASRSQTPLPRAKSLVMITRSMAKKMDEEHQERERMRKALFMGLGDSESEETSPEKSTRKDEDDKDCL